MMRAMSTLLTLISSSSSCTNSDGPPTLLCLVLSRRHAPQASLSLLFLMSFLRAVFESSFDGAMNELKSSADSDVTLSSASQQNGRSPCAGLRPDSLLLKTSCAAKAQQ